MGFPKGEHRSSYHKYLQVDELVRAGVDPFEACRRVGTTFGLWRDSCYRRGVPPRKVENKENEKSA